MRRERKEEEEEEKPSKIQTHDLSIFCSQGVSSTAVQLQRQEQRSQLLSIWRLVRLTTYSKRKGWIQSSLAISQLTKQKICLILKMPSKQTGSSTLLVPIFSIIDRDKMTFDLQCLVGILERILPFSKSRPPCHGNCQFQKSLWQLFLTDFKFLDFAKVFENQKLHKKLYDRAIVLPKRLKLCVSFIFL